MSEPSGHLLEQAYESVKKLVEDFGAHERDYLSPNYQESNVRQDFIDKFFTALGWDVTHERQKNPHEYEVQIEDRVSGSDTQQRADYAFFLAPNFRDPKFYVEAKKPARQLKNPDFFYQTMRYGWNGNTPIAILTDFEEFYVIDCRLKPSIKDALSREIKSFRFSDFADKEKFAWIYYIFSHEAVADGKIEEFASELRRPKGKAATRIGKVQPVDEAFLSELDGYRESLAKGFKKSNQELDGEELTEAVQRTIDRLVFIRFLEDKLIEPEREIANLIDRQLAWELFVSCCKRLDPKYNGLIFKPHRIDEKDFKPPDEEVFKEVCEGLAGRESPYNFAQIPISILGSIYERFLGKVVHATDKRVKVEEKPEVRKAGGVYYTPDYIVRYIVKETVGKLIEGKTPEEISKMAFADIACGSGSFLIEVYDLLLKYHERYYTEHPEKAKKGDTEQREGRKVLSLQKRQEILVNNIYGVDIDYQATEVTQLSLYLKLLEDVTTNDAYQFSLLKEKILPNLSKNIVCGNSLIGRDITEGNLFRDVDESKLKPMNFEDAFPEVMKRGGFDAVVGNPPYVRQEGLGDQKEYLRKNYKTFENAADLYTYFIEKAMSVLVKGGSFGYIVANKWLRTNYAIPLRRWLKELQIQEIIDFGDLQVFKGVAAYPCILIIRKDKPQSNLRFVDMKDLGTLDLGNVLQTQGIDVLTDSLPESGWIMVDSSATNLIEKLKRKSARFGDFVSQKVFYGIKTGLNDAFVLDEETKDKMVRKDKKTTELLMPYFEGKDVKRYANPKARMYLLNLPSGWTRKKYAAVRDKWSAFRSEYPVIAQHLKQFEAAAKSRYDQGEYWWELRSCDYYDEFTRAKIVYPNICKQPEFTLDYSGSYTNQKCFIVPVDDKFLLAVLNSSITNFLFKKLLPRLRGDFFEPSYIYLKDFPIPLFDLADSAEKARHEHIVQLVERMLAAKKELSGAKTEAETTRLERECETLDRQIDQAVYELYGLTEEEIKVVENV
jgi:type I restriction-modification system DNA methylase subunit